VSCHTISFTGLTCRRRAPLRRGRLQGTIVFDADFQNGLADHSLEPPRIRDVHELERNFVSEWVAQFHEHKHKQAATAQ